MTRSRFALAALALGTWLTASGAHAQPRRWSERELTVAVDPSLERLGERAVDALIAAGDVWQNANPGLPRLSFTIAEADEVGYFRGRDNHNTVRFAKYGEPRAHGALAVTVVTVDARSRRILDADVIVNGDFRFGDALDESDRDRDDGDDHHGHDRRRRHDRGEERYDLQSVLTHELGHFVGLEDDLVDPNATMFLSTEPGDVRKRDLAAADLAALDRAYVAEQPGAAGGCALAPGGSRYVSWSWCAAGLLGVGLALRGRRRFRVLGLGALGLLGPLTLAGSASALGDGRAGYETGSAVVERASSRWAGGLIVTDLELGGMSSRDLPSTLTTLGGRVGDYVQIVGHAPTPAAGDRLIVKLRRVNGRRELVYVRRDGS